MKDALPGLPLVGNVAEAVVGETLRLCPPAWTVYRVAEEDTEVGGHTIVAAEAWTSRWVVHRDGRFFERPDAFVGALARGPRKKPPQARLLPLRRRPEIGVGNRFAAVEAVLVLCTVAERFGPRAPADDVTPEPSTTPRPKGGVPVYLERSVWGRIGERGQGPGRPAGGNPDRAMVDRKDVVAGDCERVRVVHGSKEEVGEQEDAFFASLPPAQRVLR